MLVTFTLALTLACQSTFPSDPPFPSDPCATTRPIDGLLNGDFELNSPCTTIGSSFECGGQPFRGPFADGGFWIGAEGMTRNERSGANANRFLRVRGSLHGGAQIHNFVFQRVGAAPEFAALAQVEARVRLRKQHDEARITFAEPDGAAYAFTSFVLSNLSEHNYFNAGASSTAPLNPDHPDALWHVYEENNGVPVAMCWHYPACGVPSTVAQPVCGAAGTPPSCKTAVVKCQNVVGFFREHTPLQICPTVSVASALGENSAHGHAHLTVDAPVTRKVMATFRVPKDGVVRLGMRAWRPEEYVAGPQADALIEVLHQRGSSTSVVRCMQSPGTDLDGLTVLDRLAVQTDDLLIYKVSKLDPSRICDVFFDPMICYEGRRLSYRVFRAGSNVQPPAGSQPGERFQTVFVSNDAQWKSLTLAAGADWAQHWATPPMPPFEIELAGTEANVASADFDDVRGLVHYCDVGPSDLERAIESYIAWTRQISSLQRDRGKDGYEDPAAPNPDPDNENVRGLRATPYEAHRLRAASGETVSGFGPFGLEPEGIGQRLRIDFDASDYADWSWLREQEWFHRNPQTELVYSEYDCVADQWTGTLPGNQCQETGAGDWVAAFQRTNDVSILRHAAVYTEIASDHGVNNNGSPCDNGLIAVMPVQGCGTPPPPFTASLLLINALEGTGALVHTYCAVERWKLEHPGSTYLDDFDQSQWLTRARDSLPAFNRRFNDFLANVQPPQPFCTDPSPCEASAWSEILWHNMPAALDDYFGYIAGNAVVGEQLKALIDWKVQNSIAPTADELDVSAQLNCLVDSGVANLLASWFECTLRCDPNTADQVRGWLYFLPRAETVAACDPSVTAGGQLVLASRYWTKFQIRGVWINAWEQQQQQCDLAGAAGLAAIPPHYYLQGFLLALDACQDPVLREDLRDQLYTILRGTRLAFRDAWGLQYGFALHPVGWPGYAPNPATMLSVFHQRTIDALVAGIELTGWDATGVARAPAPEVAIAPPSLVSAPGQAAFSLVLRVPGETNPTTLHNALAQRTEVGWWRAVAGDWQYQILWPPQASSPWAQFAVQTPVGDEIELLLTVQPGYPDPFVGTEFKLDLHAWDAKGQWHRDTSYQQW